MEPLRARLRQVVRRHVCQAVGPAERHGGDRRPREPRGAAGPRGRRGLRAERPRPLPGALAAGCFEDQVISHNEIVQEITRKIGKMGGSATSRRTTRRRRSTSAFPDNYVPDPVHYRRDSGATSGRAPNSWEDIRRSRRSPQERRAPGRDRDVPGARLEHGQPGPDDVLRRFPPEPGEPRHAPQRRHDQRAAGDARHLPQRDDAGGLRLDRGLEQPGVYRRPALARAERDLDRAHARRAAVGDDACPRRAATATRGSRRSPAGRRSGWGSST